MSNIDQIAGDAFEVFSATDKALSRVIVGETRCTFPHFLPHVAHELGKSLTDDEAMLVRFYVVRHADYRLIQGRYGGIRRAAAELATAAVPAVEEKTSEPSAPVVAEPAVMAEATLDVDVLFDELPAAPVTEASAA